MIRTTAVGGAGREVVVHQETLDGPQGSKISKTGTQVSPADPEVGHGDGVDSKATVGAYEGYENDVFHQLFVNRCPDGGGTVPGDFSYRKVEELALVVESGRRLVRREELSWEGKLEGHVGDDGRIKDFEWHATATLEMQQREEIAATGKLLRHYPTRVVRAVVTATNIDPRNPKVEFGKNITFEGRGPKGGRGIADALAVLAYQVDTAETDQAAALYLRAETIWYDAARCLDVEFMPPSSTAVSGGQTVEI